MAGCETISPMDTENESLLVQHHADSREAPEFTLEEAIERVGYGRFQWTLLFITANTQLADAMELMVIAFLSMEQVWCHTGWAKKKTSAISTVVFAGMLVGALVTGRLSDRYGRRFGFLVTTGLCAICGVATAFSGSLLTLLILRFFVGMGVGGSPAALSLYVEFLPREARGQQLIIFLLFFSIGSMLEAVVAWMTLPTTYGWRAMLLVSALPSVLLLLFAPWWLPESPRYLLVQGKGAASLEVLKRAAAANGKNPEVVFPAGSVLVFRCDGADEAEEGSSSSSDDSRNSRNSRNSSGKSSSEAKASSAGSAASAPRKSMNFPRSTPDATGGLTGGGKECTEWGALQELLSPQLRSTTLRLCALFFLMAYVYYGLVLLTPTIISLSSPEPGDGDGAGGDGGCRQLSTLDYAGNVIANSGELPGLVLAAWLLDSIGRRQTVCLFFCLSGALMLALVGSSAMSNAVSIFVLFLARAAALGFNQSLWVYTTECYPTSVRATGLGVTTCFARIGGIATAATLEALFARSHSATLVICAFGCFLAAAITQTVPRETAAAALHDNTWIT